MSRLKGHISDWLIELGDEKSANFLEDCEINEAYIDTVFSINGNFEVHIYDVTVTVPLKTYRKINEYAEETSAIEIAITESAQSNRIDVRSFKWIPYLKNEHIRQSEKKTEEIAQLLTQEYVNKQIRLMNNSIENNPHLALGISKELIETCCKYILDKSGIEINNDWDIAKLVKETNKQIDLIPFEIENLELARTSIAKILGGFSNIVHGISELRNSYGTGHGHSPEFQQLDTIYIKLAVSASSELAIFYLSLKQLNENKSSN